MWSQVEVSIGGKLVSSSSSNYPYKSYNKTLENRCKDHAMKNMLCTELFYEDTEGNHDSLNDNSFNQGAYDRRNITDGGIEMEGYLTEYIFNLDKYLLNGVDFDLKLYLAQPSLMLMSDNAGKDERVIIKKEIFKVMMVDVGSEIVTAHSKSIEKGMTAYIFSDRLQKKVQLWHKEKETLTLIMYSKVSCHCICQC